ncbi:single-strand DNA endonuclease 1 isoform X1 [Spinacia oleracea]|uniref:Single-strand DNA endonuclease 1 isoform X1 n=2 Tax=Spinacia oleracea TaxID=3562 RepID=A0A9R0I4D9_SPIOL|nr:single-strand DNA endonuclease 1 isoform X1 [Spinacia oleracea]
MGVKNMWDILESCKKTLPLHHLQNKRVCIDLSCWMVQLQNVNRSHCAMKEKLYLRGLFHRVRALISLNCSVIFVTDGAIPAIKISTYRRRLNSVNEVTQDDVDRQKVTSLRRNMGSEFSCMIREAKNLGKALGIPCLDGIEEGEAQCALLNSESLCDGCFTSDSDVFLFGARTVYRDICLDKGGYVVCYEMNDIEKKLGLGRHSLIALALLLGSDYCHGVRGFGPDKACQIVRSVSEDVVLQRVASEGLSFLKSLKTSRKNGKASERPGKENFPDPQIQATGDNPPLEKDYEVLPVIEAYMKPECHSADSDPVYRVLAVHPFQRAELQELCSKFFGWPPEKTDEYILPRIAERELRKFANLRLSSSQLGVALPLHSMPVKCPISEVVKHRKVQGRESFEVSWEDFDGLETSIVPADLVQRACPEKIAEFEERKLQKKKQNRRKPKPKNSDNMSSVANVDAKLQSLLLDIESEDNKRFNNPTSKHNNNNDNNNNSRPKKSEEEVSRTTDNSRTENPLIEIDSEDNATYKLTSCYSTSESGSSIEDLTVSDKFLYEEYDSNIVIDVPTSMEVSRTGNDPCVELPIHQHTGLRTEIPLIEIDCEDNAATYKLTSCYSTSISGSSIEDLTVSDKFLDEEYDSNIVIDVPTSMEVSRTGNDPCVELPTRGLRTENPLIEIDFEDNASYKLTVSDKFLDEEYDSNIVIDVPTSMETDVIDLLSPSPLLRTRYVSKCQTIVEQVSVIDLSDSEMEISPDHARKARELRLFLSSIR